MKNLTLEEILSKGFDQKLLEEKLAIKRRLEDAQYQLECQLLKPFADSCVEFAKGIDPSLTLCYLEGTYSVTEFLDNLSWRIFNGKKEMAECAESRSLTEKSKEKSQIFYDGCNECDGSGFQHSFKTSENKICFRCGGTGNIPITLFQIS
jgi:hypothetical protein